MVDRAVARRYSRLAPGDSAARDQFRGRIAASLDGCCLYSAAVSGTTPGLLFNDHVERIRALGGRRMGSNTAEATRRRCNRCRPGRYHNRGNGVLNGSAGVGPEWKLGTYGRALDALEGITGDAGCDLVRIWTFGCVVWGTPGSFFVGSLFLH